MNEERTRELSEAPSSEELPECGRKGGVRGNGPHLPPDLAPLANFTPLPNDLIRNLPHMLAEQLVAYVWLLYRDWETDQRGLSFSLTNIVAGTGLTRSQVQIALRSAPMTREVAETPSGFQMRRARP